MKEKIRNYILKTFMIDSVELEEDPKKWIREILHEVRRNNERLKDMREERDRKEKDLRFMESSMVSGISYDGIQAGKNTGGKPNNVLERLEQQLIVREEINKQIVDIHLLEKSLLDNNKMLEEWIWTTIENKDYAELMIEKYIKVKRYREMSTFFEYDYVRKAISLGISILAKNI